ncbi:hypothetical protein IIA15_01215 [candidate division TA06 bacterium]|nr:hypothetical protein [candidate division TA06 bacterium]
MVNLSFLLLICSLSFSSEIAEPDPPAPPLEESSLQPALREDHIQHGLQFAYQEQYEEARAEFERVIQLDGESPAGYFFIAGLIGLYMSDFSTLEPEDEFLRYIEDAVERSETKLQENPRDPWAYFFLGGSYGYRAFHSHQKRNFLKAFTDVLKAAEALKKAIKVDSTLYDAYMGVGGYHYFVNELWGVLPFLGKGPDEGIQEVRLAVEKGRYSRIAAKDGLVLLLLREKRYTHALKISLELIGEFPNNRTFNWGLAKVFSEMGDWERALMTYEKLFALIRKGQPRSLYNLLSCQLEIARVYYHQKRFDECVELCRGILDQIEGANPASMDWGEGFPFYRDLKKETKKLLKKARLKKG